MCKHVCRFIDYTGGENNGLSNSFFLIAINERDRNLIHLENYRYMNIKVYFQKFFTIFFLDGWVGLFFVGFFYNPNISNPLYQFKITTLDCNLFISFMYWWTYFFTLSFQPTEQPNHRLNSCTSYLDRVLLRLGLLVMPLLFLL